MVCSTSLYSTLCGGDTLVCSCPKQYNCSQVVVLFVCHHLTFLESRGEHYTVLSGQTDRLLGNANTPGLKRKARRENNTPRSCFCHPGGQLLQTILLFLGKEGSLVMEVVEVEEEGKGQSEHQAVQLFLEGGCQQR